MIAAPELIDFARGSALIGDTGYDSNDLRAELKERGMKAVISSKPERKRKIPKNRALYRMRYLVEIDQPCCLRKCYGPCSSVRRTCRDQVRGSVRSDLRRASSLLLARMIQISRPVRVSLCASSSPLRSHV